jgi:hypothetical protein
LSAKLTLICTRCEQDLPIANFDCYPSGYIHKWCKECRAEVFEDSFLLPALRMLAEQRARSISDLGSKKGTYRYF